MVWQARESLGGILLRMNDDNEKLLEQIKKALAEANEQSVGANAVLDYIRQLVAPYKGPSEPLYSSAIDDLRKWSEQQDHPGLLRGALNHLEASLEQRKNEQTK